MDSNTVILLVVVAVVGVLAFRSFARKDIDKVVTPVDVVTPPRDTPDPREQEDLAKLTKAQLLELANSLGLSPPKSYTKSRIIQIIINDSIED